MIKFGNFIVTDNNSWLGESSSPGPTPPTPVLPAGTVRVRTSDGNAPIKELFTAYETATLVEGTSDVYDVYKSGTSFMNLLRESSNVVEVLGANTIGITDMQTMFDSCTSLTTVPLFDTSSVTYMSNMFYGCSSLTTVPLFDTSSVTYMDHMFDGCSSLTSIPLFDTTNVTYIGYAFRDCVNVESGALALYQQASSQTTPPSSHSRTFRNCGRDTVTGAAELAQIPNDWK